MPKREPLYPHVPKSQMQKKGKIPLETKPTRDDVRVELWEERDRLHIGIQNKETGDYLISWWDDEARQMFEDGFFKRGPKLEESVLDYAEERGFLAKESSKVKVNYYYCENTRLHSNNEVIQIKTEEDNPKCPYCGAVMTYGRYWGPLIATQL